MEEASDTERREDETVSEKPAAVPATQPGTGPILSEVEARVLGCLLEKEATTPEYYPLTLNALTAACNQKSNRDPVMKVDDSTVLRVVVDLQAKGFCGEHHTAGSRVIKYGHNIETVGLLTEQERALLAVLMLRGPQTVGELRGRTTRYCRFENLPQVESVLGAMAARESGALVTKLPRETGRKEGRYAHLLCGAPEMVMEGHAPIADGTVVQVQAENARIAALEQEVERLRSELDDLKESFAAFRSQFE